MSNTRLQLDKSRSTDKRKLIFPTTFGYLSLHYICTLPDDGRYPEDLTGLRFEFQLRSVLQHVWAEIEHVLALVDHALQYSDLEEVTSNAAFYYLCMAKVIWGDYSEKDIYGICLRLSYPPELANRICSRILRLRDQFGVSCINPGLSQ